MKKHFNNVRYFYQTLSACILLYIFSPVIKSANGFERFFIFLTVAMFMMAIEDRHASNIVAIKSNGERE